MSTEFGLAADQTLEFEVVTAAGEVVTASRSQNTDLYWALSGGGGGNYGIVTSMTVKTYPDAPVAGAGLKMSSAYTTPENFYKAISEFHELLPAMIENGTMVVYYFSDTYFLINPVTAYNKTAADVKSILTPFLAVLADLNIPYSVSFTEFATYQEHVNTYMGPLPYGNIGAEEYQFGSRLIPKFVVKDNNAGLQQVLQNVTEHGVHQVLVVGVATDVHNPISSLNVSNSVLPAWRDALIHCYFTTAWNSSADAWNDMIADQWMITDEFVPQIEAVTPGSGSYMNEADFRQRYFQKAFFGANYEKLLDVKRKRDPKSLFYAVAAVGSEVWSVADDGRMCRK